LTTDKNTSKLLLSGDEAIALAALDGDVRLGTGYPGTPSTEILEEFDKLGGSAQWSPNEKVALEVGVGAAVAGQRAIVTMKHVGLNVAADALFTVAEFRLDGALVVISADDPGMASSQNEQDNRRYAVAAGVAMLEPSDSQEAYEFLLRAIEISERWEAPVLLRLTTRVCHAKTIVQRGSIKIEPKPHKPFQHDYASRVMVPGYAKPAHRRMRARLASMARWNEEEGLNQVVAGSKKLGVVTSGISFQHVREAAPEASVFKIGMTYPLPVEKIRAFAQGVERCVVVEEGDPYLVEQLRAAGIQVEGKPEMYRFGELNVERVRRILAGDTTPEKATPPGKPPALCPGCPHRATFGHLHEMDCIVSGDIGCYSLGVAPPFEAMDTLLCMGGGVTTGLGMRHVLPEAEARRVVGVVGDSTFVHSGITGVVEMVYNPPPTGYVLLILDNGTTAMTGLQEHPGTGRRLDHQHTGKVDFEALVRALGVKNVYTIDPLAKDDPLRRLLTESLAKNELTVIIVRRNCLLAAAAIKKYEANQEEAPCQQ
jgi:indolepyruvate ferredoxin oxidoreductase alpha subunit